MCVLGKVKQFSNRLVLRGVFLSYAYVGVSFLSLLVLTRLILQHLGPVAYGVWAVLSSIGTYFSLFDLGLGPALSKYTAEYQAKGDSVALTEIASTTFATFLVTGGFVLAIALGLAPYIDNLITIPTDITRDAQVGFGIMGLNVTAMLFSGFFANLVYGQHRVDIWRLFGILQVCANGLFVIVFLKFDLGIAGLASASLASTFVFIIVLACFLRDGKHKVYISLKCASWGVFKETAPYGLRTLALGVTTRLLYYSDSIIIGIFLGSASVTPYEIAYKLTFLLTYLYSVMSTAMLPRFSALDTLGETDSLQRSYLTLAKISLLIAVPSSLCLIYEGSNLIGAWVGTANVIGQDVLLVLTLMNLGHAIGTPSTMLLQSVARNRDLLNCEIVRAGLHVILSVVLVPRIGVIGIAISAISAMLLTTGWYAPVSACYYLKLRLVDFLSGALVSPVSVGLITSAIVMVGLPHSLLGLGGFGGVVLDSAFIMTVYFVLYAAVGSTASERESCMRLLRKTLLAGRA